MAKRNLRRGNVALMTGLALVLAACGGGDDDEASGGDSGTESSAPSGECAALAAYGDLSGKKITIYTGIREIEGETLDTSFDTFRECTKAEVEYEGSGEFEAQLRVRVQGGNAPDVAFLPQPGLLQSFADAGKLLEAAPEVAANVDKNWAPAWKEYGSHNGKFYAPPLGANVKSFVWYSPSAFEEAGYTVPTTLDELKALSDKIVADDNGKAWCAGIESQDATGWPATDWLEDFILRTQGTDVYDQWYTHEIAFNDPRIQEAADAAGAYLKNEDYMNGGFGNVKTITTTAFQEAGQPILDGDCWMHRQASFYAANWPEGTTVGPDGDVFAFYLPAESADGEQPVLGAGEFVGIFNDRPEVRALQLYISTMDYVKVRAALKPGSWVTAAKGLDAASYESPIDQLSYTTLQDPNAVFRFDASDLMPAAVGAGSFWKGMTDWINGKDTKPVLDQIEASWPKS